MSLQDAAKNVWILNSSASEFVPRAKVLTPSASHMSRMLRRKMKIHDKSADVFNITNNNDLPVEVVILIFKFVGYNDVGKVGKVVCKIPTAEMMKSSLDHQRT